MTEKKTKKNIFLLEIGFEELPADYLSPAAQQLKTDVTELLKEKNIDYKDIEVYWTVRRFILQITGINEKQKDIKYIKKGPRYDVAYKDGKLTDIGKAFLSKNNLVEKNIEIKEENGQKYLFAEIHQKGEDTKKILALCLPVIIKNLKFPKSMRWDETKVTFARPLRWILCLFNNKIIKFNYGKVVSSNRTYLHKYEQSNKEVIIKSPEYYFKIMNENNIIVDQNQRKDQIMLAIDKILKKRNLYLLKDEELLDKVAGSVEIVSAMIGEFDKKYLSLPKEVIITAMREHQRYFAVLEKNGDFVNYFINIRDGGTKNNDKIVRQHSKVLFSRLNDASFFYREDLKQPLENNLEKLKEAVFIADLGNMHQKMERLKIYSSKVKNIFSYQDIDTLLNIAYLCKADLMTNMIGEKEFAGLRGFMGGIYLKEQGHDEKIWRAVMEHYLPNFVGDKLPSTIEGILISLFDKIDNLCGYFIAGFKPTGSKDPYAVRRQALNIIYMITEKEVDLNLINLIDMVNNAYKEQFGKTFTPDEIIDFLIQRQINYFKDKSIDYDIINSVIASTPLQFSDNMKKASILMQARKKPDFNDTMFAISRINNIIPENYIAEGVKTEYFDSEEERILYNKFKSNQKEIEDKIKNKNFNALFNIIASFKPEIDNYFNKVLVNTDDEVKRKNRLNMLCEMKNEFMKFADFSKIVIDRK
ncbi:MAG: glycine--tRNA ligase subunit beta [Candidatus Goldbacteria bacterium]|nr:glycine--tRNA ligase subunit beta [Candidatus Goldiibacteriota bacterium]